MGLFEVILPGGYHLNLAFVGVVCLMLRLVQGKMYFSEVIVPGGYQLSLALWVWMSFLVPLFLEQDKEEAEASGYWILANGY